MEEFIQKNIQRYRYRKREKYRKKIRYRKREKSAEGICLQLVRDTAEERNTGTQKQNWRKRESKEKEAKSENLKRRRKVPSIEKAKWIAADLNFFTNKTNQSQGFHYRPRLANHKAERNNHSRSHSCWCPVSSPPIAIFDTAPEPVNI